MESPVHSLPSLFKQLGLPHDPVSIERYVAVHSPLKPSYTSRMRSFGRPARRHFYAKKFSTMRIGLKWWMS
ncbi:DUF2789 family protein [Pseudomonas fluorescens]|uniref:DUF2789 family protein n=1 Tax=Pseudomonas fluorescens TaxID=294 RepID=UPI003CD01938